MSKVISVEDLKQLFTKTYGMDAPSKQKWAENDLKLADTQRNNLTISYVPDTLCIVMML